MSLISRAIPGLFGGVSQQIPAMRHPTQCAVQENGLSTLVDGLFKRPGSKHLAQLPNTWAAGSTESLIGNVHCHVIDRGVGKRWQVILNESGLNMVNLETGAQESVVYQTAAGVTTGVPTYLTATDPSRAYRTITVADTTFLVNTEKTVASENTDSTAAPTDAYVYVKTGVTQHTYSVTINGATASWTAGASGVTVDTVTSGLVSAINALGGGRSASTSSTTKGLIQVSYTGGTIAVTATDTYGNSTMIVLDNGVQRFADLPPSFPDTTRRIKIIGTDAGAGVDPYYVRWDGKQWRETRAYGVTTGLSAATMPHKLYKESGTWYVRPITWNERTVGDDNTNPMPSFVGRTMRDIFFFRNRLGFLAGDSLALSKAGEYFNFFSTTATDVLDSDPIDLGGSAESVDTLDWAVPYTQRLIVWASNKQQFVLEAGEILSPAMARLVPVTAFESANSARPKPLGNRMVFPSTINGYTQLQLYKVSQDTVSNTAEPITDHIPTYIPELPRSIELSETAKIMSVVAPGPTSSLYVFKYEDDGEKLSQRAWQKFTFPGGIVKAHWAGQLLYLTLLYRGSGFGGSHRLCLEVLDFSNTAVDPSLSFGMRLDRRVFVNGATSTGTFGEYEFTATMPYTANLQVFRYAGSSDPVRLEVVSAEVQNTSPTTVKFRVKAPVGTGTFVVGQPYTFKYTFTEIFMRDAQDVPIMDARLKVLKVLLRYVKTGYFKAKVTTKAGGSYEYSMNGQGVGLAGQLLGSLPVLVSGNFSIPVQAQAEATEVTVESESHLPCCFPFAEWRGNVNLKSQR